MVSLPERFAGRFVVLAMIPALEGGIAAPTMNDEC